MVRLYGLSAVWLAIMAMSARLSRAAGGPPAFDCDGDGDPTDPGEPGEVSLTPQQSAAEGFCTSVYDLQVACELLQPAGTAVSDLNNFCNAVFAADAALFGLTAFLPEVFLPIDITLAPFIEISNEVCVGVKLLRTPPAGLITNIINRCDAIVAQLDNGCDAILKKVGCSRS